MPNDIVPAPKPEVLAATPMEPPDQAIVEEIAKRDEEQIISELEGQVIDEFVYEVPGRSGKSAFQVSYAGVKECARRMGSIKVGQPQFQETADGRYYRVLLQGKDTKADLELWSVVEQSKFMLKRDGSEVYDNFALTKALSRAQRNVLHALTPEVFSQTIIEEWKRKRGMSGGQRPAAAPASADRRQIAGKERGAPPAEQAGLGSDGQQRAMQPPAQPASSSMREAALDTITTFQRIGAKHNSVVWEILSTKGYNLSNWESWDALSDEDLAYVLKEVEHYIEAETKAGPDAFKKAGDK